MKPILKKVWFLNYSRGVGKYSKGLSTDAAEIARFVAPCVSAWHAGTRAAAKAASCCLTGGLVGTNHFRLSRLVLFRGA